MARPLKYRFDLLGIGEVLVCEGAKEPDIHRRIAGFAKRRLANPKTASEAPIEFSLRVMEEGVWVERVA